VAQAYLFPGQGSQTQGMGATLFDSVENYAEFEPYVDEIMGYSLRELCLRNPDNALQQTRNTQPCLYVVNALHYWEQLAQHGDAQMFAGHSLGEYNALLAAGAFGFLDGLRLVRKRGELMSALQNGGMLAVVGIDPQQIQHVLEEEGEGAVDIANLNSPVQTILSGPVAALNALVPALEKSGAKMCIPLPVSAAFHSRYMQTVAEDFARYLRHFQFNPMTAPVIANASAQPYGDGDPDVTIKNLLVQQIPCAVEWMRSIRQMRAMGVSEFKEVGVGTVLTRLLGQIL